MATQKKQIPKFSTPTEETREIDGVSVRIHRLPSTVALPMFERLLRDVGPIFSDLLADPGRELDPDIEAAFRLMLGQKMDVAIMDIPVKLIKALILSNALSKAGRLDLDWLAQQCLPGFLWLNDVFIESMDELDESGITPIAMLELVAFAAAANFLPFLFGRNTSDGSSAPDLSTTDPKTAVRGKSNLNAARVKDGLRGPTLQA